MRTWAPRTFSSLICLLTLHHCCLSPYCTTCLWTSLGYSLSGLTGAPYPGDSAGQVSCTQQWFDYCVVICCWLFVCQYTHLCLCAVFLSIRVTRHTWLFTSLCFKGERSWPLVSLTCGDLARDACLWTCQINCLICSSPWKSYSSEVVVSTHSLSEARK